MDHNLNPIAFGQFGNTTCVLMDGAVDIPAFKAEKEAIIATDTASSIMFLPDAEHRLHPYFIRCTAGRNIKMHPMRLQTGQAIGLQNIPRLPPPSRSIVTRARSLFMEDGHRLHLMGGIPSPAYLLGMLRHDPPAVMGGMGAMGRLYTAANGNVALPAYLQAFGIGNDDYILFMSGTPDSPCFNICQVRQSNRAAHWDVHTTALQAQPRLPGHGILTT
jgi:hypothetical protein